MTLLYTPIYFNVQNDVYTLITHVTFSPNSALTLYICTLTMNVYTRCQGNPESFLRKCHEAHYHHPNYEKPRYSRTEFSIDHYAGKVTYDVCTSLIFLILLLLLLLLLFLLFLFLLILLLFLFLLILFLDIK